MWVCGPRENVAESEACWIVGRRVVVDGLAAASAWLGAGGAHCGFGSAEAARVASLYCGHHLHRLGVPVVGGGAVARCGAGGCLPAGAAPSFAPWGVPPLGCPLPRGIASPVGVCGLREGVWVSPRHLVGCPGAQGARGCVGAMIYG